MVGKAESLENPQRRRLLLALVLLLVALATVIQRDRQFWFGSDQSMLDLDGSESAVPSRAAATPVPPVANRARSASILTAKKRIPTPTASAQPAPAEAPVVATERTILPPLDVEVVASEAHSQIHPGTNAAKVEILHPAMVAPARPTAALAPATNAAEHEPMSVASVRPPAPYPLLAQHMNVQGSVVLQAVISADGVVQHLQVLSGPAILASAAQQAVREWRFKPVLQDGQRVETKAKITVNFTIKVADGSGTTLAESRTDDILIVSR